MIKLFKMIKLFTSGLLSSTAVIDKGRDVKNREVKNTKFSNCSYLTLHKILVKEIIKLKIKKFDFSFSEVVYAGHTENNLKEFNFFYDCLKENLFESDMVNEVNNVAIVDNFGFYKRKNKALFINILLCSIVYLLFVTRVLKLNATSLTYTIDYTKNFLFYFRNLHTHKSLLPSLIVLSNDHNPKYVAISKVYKYFNVKRVYMQHAAVSSKFPKLDFEYAVLTNQVSRNIYNQIGENKSKIFTISRKISVSKIEQSISKSERYVDICLLPTSIPSIDKLNKIISYLCDNGKVNNIYIKHHPRFKYEYLVNKKAISLSSIDNVQSERLICIAGNTTAALDYTLLGLEVYQCFDMDDIDRDYYGFVGEGICKKVKLDELNHEFWPFIYNIPINKLKSYCPHLEGTHKYNLEQFKREINVVLAQSIRSKEDRLGEKSIIFKEKNKKILEALRCISASDKKLVIDSLAASSSISNDEKKLISYILNDY